MQEMQNHTNRATLFGIIISNRIEPLQIQTLARHPWGILYKNKARVCVCPTSTTEK
jgi:hypothetical protein